MTITQTVEIPENRMLTIEVPREVPVGTVTLMYKPAEIAEKTTYSNLSKEDAISLTAEVIEKYRPALEDLAK